MKQKGFSAVLVLITITILALGGYLIYSNKINLPRKQNALTSNIDLSITNFTQCSRSFGAKVLQDVVQTYPRKCESKDGRIFMEEIESNWKTYTDTQNNFSFKYPDGWYYKTIVNPDGKNSVRFFQTGQKEDVSVMMHRGNEQLSVELQIGQSLDQLQKQTNIPKTIILNKPAIRLSTGIYLELDSTKKIALSISRYPDEDNILDKILSTFKFTNQ